MTLLLSKAIYVVEFGDVVENKMYMYVPRLWIMSSIGTNVIVVLPQKDQTTSTFDPDFLTRIPSCDWLSYQGTIVFETDDIEEAILVVNIKNNSVKYANEITNSCTAILVSMIKDLEAELSQGNQGIPSTSLSATKRPNIITMLEILRPIISAINNCITKVIMINRNSPVISEELNTMDQNDVEHLKRFETFSNNFAESLEKSINHHLNCLVAKIKISSVTTDKLMQENVKIIYELMSAFLVTVLAMTGKIK